MDLAEGRFHDPKAAINIKDVAKAGEKAWAPPGEEQPSGEGGSVSEEAVAPLAAARASAATAATECHDAAESLFFAFPDEALTSSSSSSTSFYSPSSSSSLSLGEKSETNEERRRSGSGSDSSVLATESAPLVSALEHGAPPPPSMRLQTVGYTLLKWASSLSDSVVPEGLLKAAEAAAPAREVRFHPSLTSLTHPHAPPASHHHHHHHLTSSLSFFLCACCPQPLLHTGLPRADRAPTSRARGRIRSYSTLRAPAQRAHAAASEASTAAAKAGKEPPAANTTAPCCCGPAGAGEGGEVVVGKDGLPAEYLPQSDRVSDMSDGPSAELIQDKKDRGAMSGGKDGKDGSAPRLALSSRLCTLVGGAFLCVGQAGGWWPAVFMRRFIDDLSAEESELKWVVHASRRHMEGEDEWRPGPGADQYVNWDGVRTELAYTFLT